MSNFFRYPQTPHLAWLGPSTPRDDKVLTRVEAARLLENEVIVEEKLDGANVGVSLSESGALRFQNRGQFLEPPFSGQFSRLTGWAAQHGEALASVLAPGLTLFGEWLAARHSIRYDKLPDWFIAFDIFDAGENGFWSTRRRNHLCNAIGLTIAPCLLNGRTSLSNLERLVIDGRSRFGNSALEGIVVRLSQGDLTTARAKLVHPNFTQLMGEHWRRRALEWNRLDFA